jgi:hypothetical protein
MRPTKRTERFSSGLLLPRPVTRPPIAGKIFRPASQSPAALLAQRIFYRFVPSSICALGITYGQMAGLSRQAAGATIDPASRSAQHGCDHLQDRPRVIKLHATCPRAGAGFFLSTCSSLASRPSGGRQLASFASSPSKPSFPQANRVTLTKYCSCNNPSGDNFARHFRVIGVASLLAGSI